MFCKHCGKELPNDSSFCTFCGMRTKDVYTNCLFPNNSRNRKVFFILIFWLAIHLFLFFCGKNERNLKRLWDDPHTTTHSCLNKVYPFTHVANKNGTIIKWWDIYYYDATDFVLYVLIIPMTTFGVYTIVKYAKK